MLDSVSRLKIVNIHGVLPEIAQEEEDMTLFDLILLMNDIPFICFWLRVNG